MDASTDKILPAELAAKRDQLLALLASFGSCAVAFSGGLDSVVLAQAAQLALGERAVAVLGVSPSLARDEDTAAEELAQQIGIRFARVTTDELSNPAYQANQADRCYHCKRTLLARIGQLARQLELAVVADGGNFDDREDFRPGAQAVRECAVCSPLAECALTKAELRQLARHWGLAVWNKPASPCLSSRIAYGERVTPERLAMIEEAEKFLRENGLAPLRVRYHGGDMARIEVPAEQLARFADPDFRDAVVQRFKALGFKYVTLDLEGFRSGSLNAVLPESLRANARGQSL